MKSTMITRIFTHLLLISTSLLSANLLKAQWTAIHSSSNIFEVAPANDSTWFMSKYYTLEKSTDHGNSWNTVINYMPNRGIEGMHIMSPTQFWVVGYENNGNILGWIARTTDGVNFQHTTTSSSYGYITDVWFIDNTTGYVTTSGGKILKSTNGGASFSPNYMSNNTILHKIRFFNTTLGIAVGGNGVKFRTTNGGASWTPINFISNQALGDITFLSASNIIIGGGNGIFKSTDGGNNWQLVHNQPVDILDFPDINTGYASAFGAMYKTTNGGSSWYGVTPASGNTHTSMFFLNPTTGYVTTSQRIFENTTGVTECPMVNAGLDIHWCSSSLQLNAIPSANNPYLYSWSPGNDLSNPNIANPIATNPNLGQFTIQQYVVTLIDTVTNCPDATDTIVVTFDTIQFIPNYTAPTNIVPLCAGDSVILDPGVGGITYQWFPPGGGLGPVTQTVVADTNELWTVHITDCAGALFTYVFFVTSVQDCDSVWPGDASYDGVANMYDLLNLGIAFGDNGPTRLNANLNWHGQYCAPWNNQFINIGDNYKHADCDGNGIVNFADTTAIIQNYGLTHQIFPIGGEFDPNDPPLTFGPLPGNIQPGDAVTIPIFLGSQSIPMSNVYGGAFSVNYDSIYIKPQSVRISYNPTWLGNLGVNAMAIAKNRPSVEKIDAAITRIDHQNTSGYGEIAQLSFVMQDDISASVLQQMLLVNALTSLYFSDEKFIDNQENPIAVNPLPIDISIVLGTEVPVLKPVIFPNPATEFVSVHFHEPIEVLKVYDIAGKCIYSSHPATYQTSISLQGIKAGIYLVEIISASGNNYTSRIILH